MRWRKASLASLRRRVGWLSARDTVILDTPSWAAMSAIVT
jgi:hypothetical protein